ncbi:MAG TPA: hypothetical protein VHS81_03495 [Caulobacteraceae bacterium]|nr:hypothetical protein [Caulobacteraceae bacterium]
MKRLLSLTAAAAALAVPMSVSAQGAGDPAFAAFQKVCWGTNGDYVASLKAAQDDGWTDTQVAPEAAGPVSVTDKAAKSKILEGSALTLLVTRGLQHTKGGDVKVDTCKLTISKPDTALIGEGKSWLGGAAPDAGDPTLAVYYVKLAPGSPNHVAQTGLTDALNTGGFVVLKFQEDADAGIMVYQAYSK